MADKEYTLLLYVDLDCCHCCNKIKKTLSKFDEIRSYSFDEKKVTIKGPFDPVNLLEKLLCKAGKCITGYEITENKEPPKETKKPKKPEEATKKVPEEPKKPPEKTDDAAQKQKPENQPLLVMGIPILIYGASPSPWGCCRDCSEHRHRPCCRDCSEGRPECGACRHCDCGSSMPFCSDDGACKHHDCGSSKRACKHCDCGSRTASCSEDDKSCKIM